MSVKSNSQTSGHIHIQPVKIIHVHRSAETSTILTKEAHVKLSPSTSAATTTCSPKSTKDQVPVQPGCMQPEEFQSNMFTVREEQVADNSLIVPGHSQHLRLSSSDTSSRRTHSSQFLSPKASTISSSPFHKSSASSLFQKASTCSSSLYPKGSRSSSSLYPKASTSSSLFHRASLASHCQFRNASSSSSTFRRSQSSFKKQMHNAFTSTTGLEAQLSMDSNLKLDPRANPTGSDYELTWRKMSSITPVDAAFSEQFFQENGKSLTSAEKVDQWRMSTGSSQYTCRDMDEAMFLDLCFTDGQVSRTSAISVQLAQPQIVLTQPHEVVNQEISTSKVHQKYCRTSPPVENHPHNHTMRHNRKNCIASPPINISPQNCSTVPPSHHFQQYFNAPSPLRINQQQHLAARTLALLVVSLVLFGLAVLPSLIMVVGQDTSNELVSHAITGIWYGLAPYLFLVGAVNHRRMEAQSSGQPSSSRHIP